MEQLGGSCVVWDAAEERESSSASALVQQVLRLLRSGSGSLSATISQQRSRFSSDWWFSQPTLGGNEPSTHLPCPPPLLLEELSTLVEK